MVIATRAARTTFLALVGWGFHAAGPARATPAPVRVLGPPAASPAHVLKPADGYYDDSFTVDAAGQHLAVIRTDGALSAVIEIVDLASGQVTNALTLGKSDQGPERGELLPDGKHGLLLVRDRITEKRWGSSSDQ